MKTNRREFLKTLLAGTAAAMVPKSLVNDTAPEAPEPQPVTGDEIRAAHVPEWDAIPETPSAARSRCPMYSRCNVYFCPQPYCDGDAFMECDYYKKHFTADFADCAVTGDVYGIYRDE